LKKPYSNSAFIDCDKKTKAKIREFLQKEFSVPKYISIPNLKLLPMSKYYNEFQVSLRTQINNLEDKNQIQLSPEQKEKVLQAVKVLWFYDLRKIITNQQFYPQIVENIFRSIVENQPIQLVQFTCTKRNKAMTNLDNYLQLEAEGSNLLPNLPFLKLIKTEFEELGIPLRIIVLLGDSENYWVDLQEGGDLEGLDLKDTLIPQWQLYKNNLEEEVNQIANRDDLLELIATSDLEEQILQTGQFDFAKNFAELRKTISSKFNLKIIARMALVWQGVLQGNQRNAFSDAENEISKKEFENIQNIEDLQQLVSNKYIDIALRQLSEYAIQGKMLEILYPNAVLLQNERPVTEKNYFYNIDLSLRNQLLPEICPYFYQ
jgi:hypothetical protein